ncbi:MAG: glycosyltransferase family 2 protein [Lachnospiraceae bacterium]|nr:glycosyltransferase family 2 protein [Lachnospiraceae bacterium]
MYYKILKIVEFALRITKLGNVIAKFVGKHVGSKKEYVAGARAQLEEIHCKADVACVVKERTVETQCNLQIIVPMHNAAEYVEQCLTSILAQNTKYTYRIILVDDGSTDQTVEIAQKYLTDERVQLIVQENAGAAAARNAGLQTLLADFLMFVDIDDALKPQAIEVLLDRAYQENAQIVEGGYEVFDTKVLATEHHIDARLEEPCGVLWGFPWGKVIASSLFCNISFPEGYWYEDTIMSYLVYPRSTKTVTIEDIVYSYRRNPRGFSHIRGNNGKLLDTYWVMELMLRDMEKLSISRGQSIYEQYLKSILTGCKRLMYMKKSIRKATLSLYSQMLCSVWEEYSTQDERMKGFEKAVRNNQYGIFKLLVLCL